MRERLSERKKEKKKWLFKAMKPFKLLFCIYWSQDYSMTMSWGWTGLILLTVVCVCVWVVRPLSVAIVGSSPSQDRLKDCCFPVLPSWHFCRFIRACLTFMCTACMKIIVHAKKKHHVHSLIWEGLTVAWNTSNV